eukprot:12399151-Karenia_brevis.AAC.1
MQYFGTALHHIYDTGEEAWILLSGWHAIQWSETDSMSHGWICARTYMKNKRHMPNFSHRWLRSIRATMKAVSSRT